jgi:GR25 family glycosyltransferase involved in LPS biosynthesis
LDIRLINLDRSPDRLATFQAVNKHVMPHVTRFSAVDGKKLERATLVERGIIAPDLNYEDGALGSAMSQITLWDLAIREDRQLTICEDDAVFNRSFCATSERVLRELPPDWHLIKWGWNFDSMLWFEMIPSLLGCMSWFDQEVLRKGIDAFPSASLCPRPFRLFQCFGNICYSISPAGARMLRQNCLPLRDRSVYVAGLKGNVANYCIDVALNGVFGHMNSFVSIPPLVVTRNDYSTSLVQR